MNLREIEKKVVVLGDGKVGKTSLVSRYLDNTYTSRYTPGTGMKIHKKCLQIAYPNLVINLKLSICDTCGQKAYHRIRDTALAGADGAIMVGDLSRPETITAIDDFWLKEIKKSLGNLPMAYIGNKVDLVTKESPTARLLENVGAKSGAPVYFSSAKTGENVEVLFQTVGKMFADVAAESNGSSSSNRPTTLMEVVDYIVEDFCAQHGNLEKALLIVQNQFKEAGVDIGGPRKEGILNALELLRNVECVLLSENMAKVNYEERRKMVESVD